MTALPSVLKEQTQHNDVLKRQLMMILILEMVFQNSKRAKNYLMDVKRVLDL